MMGLRSPSTSIHARLLIALSLAALAPAVVVSITSALSSYALARQRSMDQLESVAALKADEVDMWISELSVGLDTLIGEREKEELAIPLLRGALPAGQARLAESDLAAYIGRTMARVPVFSKVMILDGKGKVRASTDSGLAGRDLEGSDFFIQGMQRDFVSPPFRWRQDDSRLTVAAAQPLVEAGIGPVGVIVGLGDGSVLDTIMDEKMGLGTSGESWLVGADGMPLTRLQSEPRPMQGLASSAGVAQALESKIRGSTATRDYRGVRVLESYLWLPVLQAALIVQEDEREVAAGVTTILLLGLAVTALALLLTVLASSVVARGISSPIAVLSEAAARVTAGDLSPRVEPGGRDEVGALGQAFNLMTGRLRGLIGQLQGELDERSRAEVKLRLEHETARQYFENAAVLMVVLDREARIVRLNQRGCEILGYRDGELDGRDWFAACLPERDREEVRRIFGRLMASGQDPLGAYENSVVTASGQERLIRWHNSFVHDSEGGIAGLLSSGEDVTEQRRAEEQVRHSLAEKEALLRELHHRTKNNMGVIIGLLALQAAEIDDERLATAFADIQSRIQSMALVHQKLYEAHDLSRINLKDYVSDLAALLLQSYQVSPARISLVMDTEDVQVLIDTAIPCGLILNELVSNALKYAFAGGGAGKLMFALARREGGEILLEVADDGPGLPAGFDPRTDGRMGLQTIVTLGEEQLGGRVEFEARPGFRCRIIFRDDIHRARV